MFRILLDKLTLPMKRLSLIIIICFFSINLFSQTGHYILKPNKKTFPLVGFRFHTAGYLDINPDSTYNFVTYWESFKDWESGSWKLFGDTLVLNSSKVFYGGNVDQKYYSYSFSRIDTIKNKVIFKITEQSGRAILGYKASIFLNNSESVIKFDLTGTYTLNSDTFDSLIIKTDKYLYNKVLKISPPVCCNENFFQITLGLRRYIINRNKIMNLNNKTILTKHKP